MYNGKCNVRRLSVLVISAVMLLAVAPAFAQKGMPARTLSAIKDATVFVNSWRPHISATGSGFIIAVKGKAVYVATNAHTVMLRGKPASSVLLTFRSGTPQEKTVPARVVCRDDGQDLAVLKVTMPKPPRPINLGAKPTLKETMTIYAFGFPFGKALAAHRGHPAITVSKGTISSIRYDDYRRLRYVQIDGDINPGNSGGPVVDTDGRLIGIAVAKVIGTQIGLAIPPEKLQQVLDGKPKGLALKETANEKGKATIAATVELIDPMKKIKSASVLVIAADKIKTQPSPSAKGLWRRLHREAELHKFKIADSKATGSFALPTDAMKRKAYLFQVRIINGNKETLYTRPVKFFISPANAKAAGTLKPTEGNEDDEDDWLGDAAVTTIIGKGKKIRPKATGKLLAGKRKNIKGAVATPINIEAKKLVANIQWVPDGKSFFALTRGGLLRKISVPGLVEVRRIDIKNQCSWMALSKEGLVVLLDRLGEVWLFETETLRLKHRVAVRGAAGLAACPATSVAFVTYGMNVAAVNLKTGKVTWRTGLSKLVRQAGETARRHRTSGSVGLSRQSVMSPDGKYLFILADGCLHRFAVKGNKLEYEESGPSTGGSNPLRIEISGDSRYVALLSGGGNTNPGDHPDIDKYGTYLYHLNNLQTPVTYITQGPYPTALAFDRKARLIYGQNINYQLIAYRPGGTKVGMYRLAQGETTAQLAACPKTRKVLVLTTKSLFWVEMPHPGNR